MATIVEPDTTSVPDEAAPPPAPKRSSKGPKLDQLDIFQPEATKHLRIEYIPRELIHPDPEQPRKEPDAELRESIARNGILQPITVRRDPERIGQYVIVAGERRWKGSEGVQTLIPCQVREDLEDRAFRLQTQLVENTNKPLTPIEEARSYHELMLGGRFQSVAQLAKELGRPETSVRERLDLMQLGAWIPLIEAGRIPSSYAVRALLPVRGCPDAVHEQVVSDALDAKKSELLFDKTSVYNGTFEDFSYSVVSMYKPFLYPLTKSKSPYEPQPAFNTSKHDAECECGRIQFALTRASKRAYCGNPEWWKPLDAAAKKEKHVKNKAKGGKTTKSSGAAKVPRYYAPVGAVVKKLNDYNLPAHLVEIAQCSRYNKGWNTGADFDPSALELEPSQLQFVTLQDGRMMVATTKANVEAARTKWRERWEGRRQGVVKALGVQLKEKAKEYRVSGPGVPELLARVDSREAILAVIDIAEAHDVELPKGGLKDSYGRVNENAYRKWVSDLDEADLTKVATALACVFARRITPPTSKVEDEIQEERQKIKKRPVPWARKPKGGKSTKATAAADDDDQDEEELDDEELEDGDGE